MRMAKDTAFSLLFQLSFSTWFTYFGHVHWTFWYGHLSDARSTWNVTSGQTWHLRPRSNPLSDSVVRSDQFLLETSGADQWNRSWNDWSAPLISHGKWSDRKAESDSGSGPPDSIIWLGRIFDEVLSHVLPHVQTTSDGSANVGDGQRWLAYYNRLADTSTDEGPSLIHDPVTCWREIQVAQ